MRVLILAILAIAAVSCTTILRTEGLSAKPSIWCEPNSNYSASTDDVLGGGTCFCSNDGSIGHCHTVYSGANFSYTQNFSEKKGDLSMCTSDRICFKLPRKKDLPNTNCEPLIQPSLCTAEQDGKIYKFYMSLENDIVDGSVIVNGETYQILPFLENGQRRYYL